MGIQGFLPLLKSIMVPIHIKDLEGCCVAIDTYSWLHKGALSCSKELCKGQSTSKHIDYCMHRVNLLRHYGIRPILVFDGGPLPMKSEQESKRARSRKENLARAMEHESNGNNASAYECYQKAVDISPSVAYELIQVLKKENVYYVVAPYEADAQMTFLAVGKQVDAVITEDSDLIAFGCPRIIYKMDKFGQGVEFRYSMLQQNKELNFTGFTKQMLLEMCILSGCDYLQSLPGMGLKKAHALVKKFRSYDKVIKHLKYSTAAVSPSYEESFTKAIMTFQHQRVYDPTIEDIVHLSDLPQDIGDDLDFLGPAIPQHIAKGIARGDLDPFTKMPIQGVNNGVGLVDAGTYKLNPEGERKKLDLPAQKNLLTNYFCFASLEAKRRFMAPRSIPKHRNPMIETCSTVEHISEDADACKTNCSPKSLLDSRCFGIASPSEGDVKHGVAAKSPESFESPSHGSHDKAEILGDNRSPQDPLLQQSRHSIPKLCMTLQKEREKFVADVGQGKTRKENTKVIVRSSYFQPKLAKENDEENIKEDVTTDKCDNINSEREYKSASDAGEAKTRMKNRKTIVTSSYFLHKSVNENDQNNRNEKLIVKDDFMTRTYENAIPESASGDSYYKSAIMKRKAFPVESVQMENTNYKCMRMDASLPIESTLNRQSSSISTLDNTTMETKAEGGKFGSNISHLENYSDIAEKSIERFVSVISSFKCSSSGSRASGLRAPLKEVQNTHTSRSNIGVDFSNFAYVPTNQKAPSAYRRC
ncbi:Exonuclease [Actinidia chinensis var. chinensis]|uniref:Exonuclease 1 n=1 Tax=Actinidia chinensis var. chinensis TaxID=1590841 RepID=A0A2R6Q6S1_ACTCC|nr:Exonuclease [Actinidia chinensis var. chinensis]